MKIRECVQILALGHANADYTGAHFLIEINNISTAETESARGQTSSSRQFTKVIKS